MERTIICDFIDSNESLEFKTFFDTRGTINDPSMILIEDYVGKPVRENTIYALNLKALNKLKELNLVNQYLDSYLIGYEINASLIEEPIFHTSVSLGKAYLPTNLSEIEFPLKSIEWPSKSKKSVNVRNVGHGNWNEILFGNLIKIVYDAGGPLYASKEEIDKIIGNRNILYPSSKPILILSHWDKDHYHSLLGMTVEELKNNFSSFICRSERPNLTSRLIYGRLLKALGQKNVYDIVPTEKDIKLNHFSKCISFGNMITLYNSQYSKDRNNSSLILLIKTRENSILLASDAHYKHLSKDILPQLNFKHKHHLVVPHHGGEAGRYLYVIPNLASVGIAAISIGRNNYKHPNENFIESLLQTGFKIFKTNTKPGDIIISL
ncbi:hypothetical protein [Sphingobacterium siyangense]|uniref:hypothetical protein n=1 Tax=Sphingobacterium siyangense TaxID=459529 RepID=UPI003DA46CCB